MSRAISIRNTCYDLHAQKRYNLFLREANSANGTNLKMNVMCDVHSIKVLCDSCVMFTSLIFMKLISTIFISDFTMKRGKKKKNVNS